MHLAFDILRGLGIACAIGVRPFLPALAAGAFASGGVEIHFDHTSLSFLQHAWFLLVLAVLASALSLVERRLGLRRLGSKQAAAVLVPASAALGALMFAAILEHRHDSPWPGVAGGIACALLAAAATRPRFARVAERLDEGAGAALPLYAESAGLLLSVLSIVAAPVGAIGLLALAWLLIGSRRRAGEKYAGLRILR
jgi:hypothetical protein